GGARTVRSVDDGNCLLGQLETGVELGDGRVVPGLDLAQEDVGDGRTVENQRAGLDAGDVDDRHDAAHHHRELRQSVLVEVGALQRRVGGTEGNGAGVDLLDAAAGTDRLVVQADAGRLLIGIRPFRVNRIRERSAGTRNLRGDCDCADSGNGTGRHQG